MLRFIAGRAAATAHAQDIKRRWVGTTAAPVWLKSRPRPWVGCSHWTTPFRPTRPLANRDHSADDGADSLRESPIESDLDGTAFFSEEVSETSQATAAVDTAKQAEGITVDRIETTRLNRPQLPSSIKKLNRLLSHNRSMAIPDSDLLERFVKGRGPGGQAINKTNSSVSLTHLPTGIRVQAQPTRSREENRKIARKILAERLDLLRAHEAARLAPLPDADGGGLSRKEEEKGLAKVWSREEIRWEKERRRKLNKAKKSKKKRKAGEGIEPADEGTDATE